jgi:hypothetical protein
VLPFNDAVSEQFRRTIAFAIESPEYACCAPAPRIGFRSPSILTHHGNQRRINRGRR